MFNKFLVVIHEMLPNLKMDSYIGGGQNLKDLLKGFFEGKIATNMLNEGVDAPRTQVGIFASTTRNSRQFIQRRGRLLRKHDKT